MKLLRRLKYWLRARQNQADLTEEMELHREMLGGGRAMGNATLAREDARAVWIWPWLESVIQDLRYALRNLRAHPGFAIVAILALGIAIGLNTSFFTVFDAVALRPWPVKEPSRMVKIFSVRARPDLDPGFSIPESLYFAEHARSFRGITITQDVNLRFGFEPFGKSTRVTLVSGNHFQVLGLDMMLGRGFMPEEDRVDAPQPVTVLSYSLWRDHFSSDPEILGKTARIEDVSFIVVGVAPENFLGTSQERVSAWVPTAAFPMLYPNQSWARNQLVDPGNPGWMLAGRLGPNVSRAQAQVEIETLSRQFRAQFAVPPVRVYLTEATMLAGHRGRGDILPVFKLMFTGVTLIVLLACANVGNLLVARAAARRREIEVRRSLGAGRARIIRQLLTESFVLALGAAALGIGLAHELPPIVMGRLGEAPPVRLEPDGMVLGYVLALAIFACVAFGLAPALHGTRMKASRTRFPLRSVLLASQVAMSVVLLAGAALLFEGIRHVRTRDPGFSSRDVTVVAIDLPAGTYDRNRIRAFSGRLLKELQGRPDLGPVALASNEPLGNSGWGTTIRLPNESPSAERAVISRAVSAGYFAVLRIPLIAGRDFQPSENTTRRPIVINQAMARTMWGDANAVGKTALSGSVTFEVIGVVRDTYSMRLDRVEPVVYQPFGGPPFVPKVLIRSAPGAAEAVAAILRQIDGRARTLATPLSDNIDRWGATSRMGAQMAGMLGIFALALATIGMAGVFAYSVQQRTKEIGIRMALGAKPQQVIALVLSGTARAVCAGLAIGYIAAIFIARLLTGFLYGVSPFDLRAYAAVAIVLGFAGLAAAFWPARRATKIDPMTALRCE